MSLFNQTTVQYNHRGIYDSSCFIEKFDDNNGWILDKIFSPSVAFTVLKFDCNETAALANESGTILPVALAFKGAIIWWKLIGAIPVIICRLIFVCKGVGMLDKSIIDEFRCWRKNDKSISSSLKFKISNQSMETRYLQDKWIFLQITSGANSRF